MLSGGEAQQQPTHVLRGHSAAVLCVALSSVLRVAASGSHDGTAALYTLRDGRRVRVLREPAEQVVVSAVPGAPSPPHRNTTFEDYVGASPAPPLRIYVVPRPVEEVLERLEPHVRIVVSQHEGVLTQVELLRRVALVRRSIAPLNVLLRHKIRSINDRC